MKVEIEVVRPNLHYKEIEERSSSIYLGLRSNAIISVAQSIDDIVKKHIGELKVKESDLKVLESKIVHVSSPENTIPIGAYLKQLNKRYNFSLTNKFEEFFKLNYIIDSQTEENYWNIQTWLMLQRDLADPEKVFDNKDKGDLVFKIDRKKSLDSMKKLYEEIDPKIPTEYCGLFIMHGHDPREAIGYISLTRLKGKDNIQIKKAESELMEYLKDVNGPCLSLDAPAIINQIARLQADLPLLIERYGDIITSPNWKARLFRLDP